MFTFFPPNWSKNEFPYERDNENLLSMAEAYVVSKQQQWQARRKQNIEVQEKKLRRQEYVFR